MLLCLIFGECIYQALSQLRTDLLLGVLNHLSRLLGEDVEG